MTAPVPNASASLADDEDRGLALGGTGRWRIDSGRAAWTAVALMAAVGLALRLSMWRQNLLWDELLTFSDVHLPRPGGASRSLIGVVREVRSGVEDNPPLFFILAWLAAKLGDPTLLIRLPAIVAGTACIPLTYALGLRTVGRAPGLVGAAALAVGPFSVYYGSEARAYSLAMLLSVASTLLAVELGRRDGSRWWAGYVLAATGLLYTHYTGAFVVGAQVVWLWWQVPQRRRELTLAVAAIALLFLPWLIAVIGKPTHTHNPLANGPATAASELRAGARSLLGNPAQSLGTTPGSAGIVLLCAFLALAACGAVLVAAGRRPSPGPGGLSLLVLVVVAVVAGSLLFGTLGSNPLTARFLAVAIPAVWMMLTALATALPRPFAVLAVVLLAVAGLSGLRRGLDDVRGTQFRAAGEWIDSRARPGDVVARIPEGPGAPSYVASLRALTLVYLTHPLPVLDVRDPATWADRRSGLVYVTDGAWSGGGWGSLGAPAPPLAGPGRCHSRVARPRGKAATVAAAYGPRLPGCRVAR